MAQLAENSIVIAFRDWQWRNLRPNSQSPDLFLSLEGNAERKKGDAEVAFDDRFYIFEIKSTENTIKDEWTKKKKLNGISKPNPKWAYRKVRRLLRVIGKREPKSPYNKIARSLLNKSLACHHFLFWQPCTLPNDARGDFAIVPYAVGLLKLGGLSAPNPLQIGNNQVATAVSHLKKYDIGLVKKETKSSIYYESISTLHPDFLATKSGRLITTGSDKDYWQHFGLELDELQEYVDYLCGNVDEEINVVLTSRSGSVFAHITRTTALKSLVDAYFFENRPAPSNTQIQKFAARKPPMLPTPKRRSAPEIANDQEKPLLRKPLKFGR